MAESAGNENVAKVETVETVTIDDEIVEEGFIDLEFPELNHTNLEEMLQTLEFDDMDSKQPSVTINQAFKFQTFWMQRNGIPLFCRLLESEQESDGKVTTRLDAITASTKTLCCEIKATDRQKLTALIVPDVEEAQGNSTTQANRVKGPLNE